MTRSRRGGWAGAAAATLACLCLALSGCELFYYLGAKNTNPAAFTFPKGHKLVVVVDLGSRAAVPPSFTTTLADDIGRKIWQTRSVDVPLISQDRIVELRQANPDAWQNMKLGDIAQAVHADNVLYVEVTTLEVRPTLDGTAADGLAEVRIKVLDRDGKRVWPADAEGFKIQLQVSVALITDRSVPETIKALSDLIVTQVDAKFHESEDTGRHVNGGDANAGH